MSSYLEKFVLTGKKAVVSGGAGLIGREISIALSQAGAKVLIADVNEDKGKPIAYEMKKIHLDADYIQLDITDLDHLEENIDNIALHLGGIDVWVNCSYPRTLDWGALPEDITVTSWRQNVDAQLNSYSLASKYVAECMKGRGGSIINFGSIYGVVGGQFPMYEGTDIKPVSMIYSAIKGGLVNLGRFLASYYGQYNVRVNTICPGGIEDGQDPEFLKRYGMYTPMKRMAKPDEVAAAVLFLASDASSYVTGHELMVDGGWTAV